MSWGKFNIFNFRIVNVQNHKRLIYLDIYSDNDLFMLTDKSKKKMHYFFDGSKKSLSQKS